MQTSIPFAEGEYLIEKAFLVAHDNAAVSLEQGVIEVFEDNRGNRHVKGSALVHTHLVVELLEDDDRIDLILDLGGEFKYRMNNPHLKGGKAFAPDVKSPIQFGPAATWEQLPAATFDTLMTSLRVL